jgi:hypothetical protein
MSTLVGTALLLAACSRPSETPPAADPSALGAAAAARAADAMDGGSVEFINESFEDLYPLLLRKKMPQGPKAALWARKYYGKWVRWTGTVVSFTQNGVTFKQLKQTVTFDVSLWIEAAQRPLVRERLKKGDRVTYVGMLDSFDDIFRTLYLTHGGILIDTLQR